MKTNKLFFKGFLIALCTGVLLSCSKDELIENETESNNPFDGITVASKIIDLGVGDDSFFETYPSSRIADTLSESISTETNGNQTLICTTKKVSVTDGSTGFQLFGGLSNNIIFPGNLLQGKTVVDPTVITPSIIPVNRAAGTISINLNGGIAIPAITVDEVKRSTIQGAINDIINSSSASNAVPSNFILDIKQIESEEQLALEMGLSFEGYGAKASASLSFSTEKSFNRTLVKLSQTFYTMNYDVPTRPDDIFASDVTQEEYAPYISDTNPATFISSVAYGRIFYMLIESTSSREEMKTKLDLAYSGFGSSVEGSLDVNAFRELNDLKIKVIAYGGDAVSSIALAGETSVAAIADKLANSTNITAALPLSYEVRSVYDPARVVGVALATEFDAVTCKNVGNIPAGYAGLIDLFDDGIGAMAQIKESTLLIYNMAGDKYTFYNVALGRLVDGIIYTHNDPNGPLGVSPLNTVGAAYLSLHRNDNNKIFLFDRESGGLEVARMDFDKNKLGSLVSEVPTDIGAHYPANKNTSTSTFFSQEFNGPSPIGSNGIDAALSYESPYPRDQYFFAYSNGSIGTTTYGRINDDPKFDPKYPLYDVRGNIFNAIYGLENIGAAAIIRVSGETEVIHINLDGTQLAVRMNGVLEGPFTIN